MSELDKIPEEGDTFSYKNVDVAVTKTDARRVVEIEAKINPIEDEDSKEIKEPEETRDESEVK